MEPLEFEKIVKEKLSGRELEVSKDAWKRLSKQLDAEVGQQKGEKINYKHLLVAASLVGVLFMAVFYGGIQETTGPIIVTTPVSTSPEIPVVKVQEQEEKEQNLVVQEAPVEKLEEVPQIIKPLQESKTTSSVAATKKPKHSDFVEEKPIMKEIMPNEALVASVKNSEKESEKEAILKPMFSDSLIQTKASKLAAVVTKLEQENQEVSEAEIDALLAQAQQEILMQKQQIQYHQSYQTIDATALLLDVESELDQSFKEQVYEALKTSFKKVRTAMRR